VRDLVAGDPLIAGLTECMLRARAALWQEYLRLHNMVLAIIRRDELCRRFMRIPDVGPISALGFKTSVDDPPSVPPLEDGRSLSQDDVAALAVRHRDRRPGTHLDGRRWRRPASTLRGRQRHARPLLRL
jgi:transposase